jgi:hypothetical protein
MAGGAGETLKPFFIHEGREGTRRKAKEKIDPRLARVNADE